MRIAIIGSGISGISAAAYAAKDGHEVHVFEKNESPGGRARQFKTDSGYLFDMGPSWYWMPDIIESFFSDFGYKATDFFKLIRLDPQFEMVFSDGNLSLPDGLENMRAMFESVEPGSGDRFTKFMKSAQYKYEVGMGKFVMKPCHSWTEFITPDIASSALKLDLLTNYRSYVRKYFSHPKLIALMEFPVIFLGASPRDIPAMYSLMNYGGYGLGTHYPLGGFHELVKAMQTVAEHNGAVFHFNQAVQSIAVKGSRIDYIRVGNENLEFDAVIAASDYHHTESLLEPKYRNYTDSYWKSRVFAPSCLIFYLGFKTLIPKLAHHTLFFEHELDEHIDAIYTEKKWPESPLFYACCPSRTDSGVAPAGHENVFLLMPLAIGIDDGQTKRKRYLDIMLSRLEKHTGQSGLHAEIDYCRSYCVSDFVNDYNAYGGNAYGLANTLRQTAVLKPSLKNRKIENLFYAGQLTVPGPGVPPSIISGKIAANEIRKNKFNIYEKTI